jgi:hypothetical protein
MKIVITEEQYVSIVSSLDEVSSSNIWNKERFENLVKDNPKYLDIDGNPFDYSMIDYGVEDRIRLNDILPIICHAKFNYGNHDGEEHGDFPKSLRTWVHHPSATCPKCVAQKLRDDFIEGSRANHIDPDKYDYSLVDYTEPSYLIPGGERDGRRKFPIFCKKHNEFFMQDHKYHKSGGGCPSCAESKGEAAVALYLESKGINFEKGRKFTGLINQKSLSYDFYLPDYKILIEFDGELHFEPSNHTNGVAKFETQKINDRIKDLFAIDNPDIVRLIRVYVKTDTKQIKDIPDILNILLYKKTNEKIIYSPNYPKI